MKIKFLILITFVFFSTIVFFKSIEADEITEKVAVKASEAWLSLVDDGNYSKSWEQASQYFQNAIDKSRWQATLRAVRAPLGKVVSREILSKQYMESLPGAPDGKYVVIQYKTSFIYKKSAVETITPMLDTDGKWRVSGYFIR